MRRCDEYEAMLVQETLEGCIEALGGIGIFVKPGERVLIKPNLLRKSKPSDATTTHPVVVAALAEILIKHGATVVIGDSPGGPFSPGMLNGIYKSTGMEEVAGATGASLNKNFGSYTAENPAGKFMKKLLLCDMKNDVDKIICVAKLKTHAMMTYTGAVKNMFGMVPGVAKAEYHLNIPDYNDFADALIDICLATEPVLTVMDGIVGMEGNGPAAGVPVKTNALLVSPSPYHLDMAACRLIGLKPEDVPMLRCLDKRGFAKIDLSDIEFIGDSYDKFSRTPYKPPETKGVMNLTNASIPNFVRKFVAKYVQTRPIFNKKVCNGCGVCREACPPKIIEIKNSLAGLDYKDCIRCYCCQELCPKKAISIKRPFLSRIMRL